MAKHHKTKRIKREIGKEILEKLYLENRLPIHKIAEELETTYKHIRYWLLKHEIKIRTYSEAGTGVPKSEITKQRMKESIKIRIASGFYERYRGSNNPNWTGNPKDFLNSIRTSYRGLEWRKKVYERDKYTCQICKDATGGNLNADHIIPLSVLVAKNNIKTRDEALTCEELWDINNGRTLCETCHKNTDTWGYKSLKLSKKIINEKS